MIYQQNQKLFCVNIYNMYGLQRNLLVITSAVYLLSFLFIMNFGVQTAAVMPK